MKILLVTWTDKLLETMSVLSPDLEYCAIVTDEAESARNILKPYSFPPNLIYPLYELKECIQDFWYDYVVCVEDSWWTTDLLRQAKNYIEDPNKLVLFNALNSMTNFLVEHSLRYFEEHTADFEMFATGISLTAVGLDVTQFKRKLFNFGRTGQDLYYNFQVAKRVVLCGGA